MNLNTETISRKIEDAMNDEDFQRVMHKASLSFSAQLSSDEIKTCHLNALWKAFEHYRPGRGAAFFTYLHKGVVIECLRELKFNNKFQEHQKIHPNIPENKDYHFSLELKEEMSLIPNKELVKDRLDGMSIKEIAEKYGYNRETARRKIKKSMARLANKMK